MEKQKFDDGVISRVKDLAKDKGSFYRRDVDDADSARSALSGFGFDEKDRAFRGELKPEVTIPILDSWINQTVSSYTSAPFGLGLKSQRDITALRFIFDKVQDDNALTDLISTALAGALNTGMQYLLVSSEVVDEATGLQDPVISVLDARKVLTDLTDDPEMDDCAIACVVEVMGKAKAAKKFGINEYDLKNSADVLSGQDIAVETRTQCSVLTVYEKVESGVMISKIVGNTVVAQNTWPLSRIPIARIYCDECWIEKELHYRGIYHKVVGLWKMANYGISEVQARIARAKQADWVVDPTSTAKSPDDWAAGSDAAVLNAESWNGEKELRAPFAVDKTLGLQEPLAAVQTVNTIIRETLGGISGEGKGIETAEAVLARKAVAEASISKYLANLKKSMKSIGRSILDYIAVCYDVPRNVDGVDLPVITTEGVTITVDGGPAQATQRQKTLQQILTISDMAGKAGMPAISAKILPTIVDMSDMPEDVKKRMQSAVAPQGQAQMPPEIVQQMQAKDQQMAQQQQALAESQKNVAQLQQALFEMQTDSKAALLKTQMEIESRERIEMMKLQAQGIKLDKELMAEAGLQTQKLMADYQKAMGEARVKAAQVDQPLFSSSKFTS